MGKGRIHIINKGGLIVVHLIDEYNTTYFKTSAIKENKKDVIRLMNELKDKGFTFPNDDDWFD